MSDPPTHIAHRAGRDINREASSGTDAALRPLSARSIVLSILLGSHPPEMPVSALLELTTLFGIADGTVRTALSRLVANGELDATDGNYRLAGRLLDRQAQQDTGRAGPPDRWDATWWFAVVVADRRSVADRRLFRSRMVGTRFGELRPDIWLRPANIDVPDDLPDVLLTRGPLLTGDAHSLVRQLWAPAALDSRARGLLAELDRSARALGVSGADADGGGTDDTVLPGVFVTLAACLRHLRTEPQLPAPLTAGTATRDLRRRYDTVVGAFQHALTAFFDRRGVGRSSTWGAVGGMADPVSTAGR